MSNSNRNLPVPVIPGLMAGYDQKAVKGKVPTRIVNAHNSRVQEILTKGHEGALVIHGMGVLAVGAHQTFAQVAEYATAATDRQPHDRARANMQAFEENILAVTNDQLLDAYTKASQMMIGIVERSATPAHDDRPWYVKALKPLPDE